ncbi:wyosine [tRNA(Phe)-imidazoG37] synthetase, radical SAM superfamily [Campylobacter pinnipediorum subsp. caledonicus]|uniref:Wyosine [tRNA(Phe)-imidazoG37] synthetase, radical SAM superfamily n=1 Tax=Campylobacter pinnipediorum subsp. caledonicus TaxID=1874362 RepID=A0A1S6U6P9_9BACT|nr:radical SAM protein [Campylobacter pinnipediorum]AQW85744.1 wyosine [tRNA(Phe)-imidazoG37] synthetase, radical SAM superfamily [Campylobacter pinnipediorum subsp. caledonicus]AQW87355.1 wyosine [tRNA(Phe)-imidazoG37] synthetase, radical SAM superfamily [Campylobacter pinnipediorum subsp. caledonicus]OPA72564.1 radical SAM protein [Campylobacter pinnipediorum subsp. caledonicus]
MSLVFGPIHSRRFGMSLGIDLSPFSKSCNFDCVYCEIGKGKITQSIEIQPDIDDIIDELKLAISKHKNIDVITVSASGEPTLYKNLKKLVYKIKDIKKDKKLLILSNATGLLNQDTFESLLEFDIAKFSLDSVVKSSFKKLARIKDINLEKLISNMKFFREKFNGQMVIEILVVKNINDSDDEFVKLNDVLNFIKPDRVDIGSIDRPPAYKVTGVGEEILQKLASNIKNIPVNIIKSKTNTVRYDFTKDEIMQLLLRRPQTMSNINENFSDLSKNNLNELIGLGKIYKIDVVGVEFYKVKEKI